jgi:hypothetical protein
VSATQSPTQSPTLDSSALDAELHLMGASRLGAFVQFVRLRAVGGRERDESDTADMWRAAAKHYEALRSSEAAVADKPHVLPLPRSMQPHIDKLTQLDSFAATFSSVPIAFGMVPLAQLVCSQFDLTLSTVQVLKQHITPKMRPAALAKLCLPLALAHGHCVLGRETRGEYVFHSDSHDLRYLGAQLVPVANIQGYRHSGHAQAAIVIGVGFSTNVLNVVRYGDRLVLNNGYHRAMALLSQGYTHAPCVIQVCGHWEDVGLCAMGEISGNSELYFSNPRPPLLRDFLNPALTSHWQLRPVRRQITVKLSYESCDIAQSGEA